MPLLQMNNNVKHKLYGIGFMCLFGLFSAAVELSGHFLPDNYGPVQTVWVRYGVHLLFMLLILGPRHKTNLIRTKLLKLQLLRLLLMIGMPVCFIVGLHYIPIGNMWAGFWVSPLMIMGLAQFLLGETIELQQWILAIFGMGGAFLFYKPGVSLLSWHIIFPLGMAFCFSLYIVMTRQLRTERTITNLFYTALVVFIPWSVGGLKTWHSLTPQVLAVMAAIGLLGYAALYFLDKACEEATVSTLAPAVYTQIIFIIILGVFISGHFSSYRMVLSGLILMGVGVTPIALELQLPQQIVNYFARTQQGLLTFRFMSF